MYEIYMLFSIACNNRGESMWITIFERSYGIGKDKSICSDREELIRSYY